MSNVIGQMVASSMAPLVASEGGIARVQLYQVRRLSPMCCWRRCQRPLPALDAEPPHRASLRPNQVYFFLVVLVVAMLFVPERPKHAPSPAGAAQSASGLHDCSVAFASKKRFLGRAD